MDISRYLNHMKNLILIEECLVDYVGPICVFGDFSPVLKEKNVTFISATMPKEEFAIINERIPKWVYEVNLKSNAKDNVLIIKDIDKISIERQELLLEILENNQISTEKLPENLKIIISSEKKCDINPKIRDIVECYEV